MRRADLARATGGFLVGIALACVARGAYPPGRGWGLLGAGGALAGLRLLAQAWRSRACPALPRTPASWYGRPTPPRGSFWQPGQGWRAGLRAALLVAVAAGLGFGRGWGALGPAPPSLAALSAQFRPLPGGRVWLCGTVVTAPEPGRWGSRLHLRPEGAAGAAGLISVTLTGETRPGGKAPADSALQPGVRLAVPARLTRPAAANPGEEPFAGITPNGRVLAFAWAARVSAAVRGPAQAPGSWGGWLARAVDAWNRGAQRVREVAGRVLTCRMGGETAGIARALVLGERELLGEEQSEEFARAGAVHLLVVSGLHLSVVAGLAAALARAGGFGERGQAVASVLAALGYGSLTGWAPPVVRAALMTVSARVARLFGRRADPEGSLWLAVCLMLLYRPLLFCDAGFRLSAAATWGVVAVAPALQERMAAHRRWLPEPAGRGLAAALGAQAATLPLSLQYFGRVPLLAVLGSPLLVGLADALVEAGVLVLAVGGAVPACAAPLSAGFGAGTLLLWQAARLVGRLPWASLNLPAWPEWCSVLYYAALWRATRRRAAASAGQAAPRLGERAWLRLPAGVAAAVLVLILWSGWSPILEATFLSVGQADALHLRLPGGVLGPDLLVDTGNSAARIVGYLRRCAVQRLSVVIITHPHHDHRGGLAGVEAAFPVRRLVDGGEEAWRATSSRGVELRLTGSPPGGSANESSRRLMVRYGRFCLIATGDAPLTAGDPLLTGLPPRGTPEGDALTIVVKVPHHGAKGMVDPEFLRRYRPDLAVIQVGPNAYGHPNAALVELLQGYGTKVTRTDREGAVRVRTDGCWVGVRTYSPQ
ncbi:MAG: ComEC/Rec2 family competence protein [Chitinophagales bacterium]